VFAVYEGDGLRLEALDQLQEIAAVAVAAEAETLDLASDRLRAAQRIEDHVRPLFGGAEEAAGRSILPGKSDQEHRVLLILDEILRQAIRVRAFEHHAAAGDVNAGPAKRLEQGLSHAREPKLVDVVDLKIGIQPGRVEARLVV